jgi:hypothetical protein
MNNKDIGFFALNLQNNDLHDKICLLIDTYISKRRTNQIVLFNHSCEKVYTGNIPFLPISYAKYFFGNLVVFDIASLLIAIECVNVNNVYFYAQNTPWTSNYTNYDDWSYLFGNPKVKTIANTKDLFDIYNLVWGNSLGISEDISYDKFSQFI